MKIGNVIEVGVREPPAVEIPILARCPVTADRCAAADCHSGQNCVLTRLLPALTAV